MSYQIIKKITIDEKEVRLLLACSNTRPLTFRTATYKQLNDILQKKGKKAVELQILKDYESGEFHGGNNKYTKAFDILNNIFFKEYYEFDWNASRKKRKSKEFEDLLLKCLNYKLKEKYVLSTVFEGVIIYLYKIRSKRLFWTRNISNAKIYKFQRKLEDLISRMNKSDNLEILKV